MKMRIYVLFVIVALLGGFIQASDIAQGNKAQANVEAVPPEAVKALLAEDWTQVANLLTDDLCKTSPVARLIKGHAYLALNRNNESVCLFLSVRSPKDLDFYGAWTDQFWSNNRHNTVAFYLRADGLARLRRYGEAVDSLSEGLKANKDGFLLLNARGVVYAKQNDPIKAKEDFENAVLRSSSSLADAYANIGESWIQRKEGAEGALRAFGKALELSPDFAVALHGKACAEVVLGRAEAKSHFEEAIDKAPCPQAGDLMWENILTLVGKATGADPAEMIAEARAGTSLERKFSMPQLETSASRWFNDARTLDNANWLPFNKHLSNFFANRGSERVYQLGRDYGTEAVSSWSKANTSLAPYAIRQMDLIQSHNVQVQPWEQLTGRIGLGVFFAGIKTGNIAAIIASGGTALAAAKTEQWSKTWETAAPRLRDGLMKSLGSGIDPYAKLGAGGVDINVGQMTWDDGRWPFKEFYCLAYGIEKGNGATAAPEGKEGHESNNK